MSTSAARITREEAKRVKRALAEQIRRAASFTCQGERSCRIPRVLRLAVRTKSFDALSWLDAQEERVRVYWGDRRRHFEMAGVGVADAVGGAYRLSYASLFARLNEILQGSGAGVRYYGGLRFCDRSVPHGCWRAFGTCRFVLPRFEFYSRDGTGALVCNLVTGADRRVPVSKVLSALDGLAFPPERPEREVPPLRSRRDTPDEAGWKESVRSVIRLFDQGVVQKLVLARRSLFEFEGDLHPIALLRRLKSTMPECFHFCFMPERGLAFIGASPERLYLRQGRRIRSEAIAGTRPRGTSVGADRKLGHDLLHNDKDLREHGFVVQGIRESLAPVCESLEVERGLSVLRLSQCQHLITALKGTLRNGVRDEDLLSRVQPTPAVGGYPTAAAVEEIGRLEPFDRGWYAGPVGWVSADGAEFAVAIRSGLVRRSRLCLFSGAGIVRGSTAEGEWNEIENKIGDFVQALSLP